MLDLAVRQLVKLYKGKIKLLESTPDAAKL
jgi:hypothetical protein